MKEETSTCSRADLCILVVEMTRHSVGGRRKWKITCKNSTIRYSVHKFTMGHPTF